MPRIVPPHLEAMLSDGSKATHFHTEGSLLVERPDGSRMDVTKDTKSERFPDGRAYTEYAHGPLKRIEIIPDTPGDRNNYTRTEEFTDGSKITFLSNSDTIVQQTNGIRVERSGGKMKVAFPSGREITGEEVLVNEAKGTKETRFSDGTIMRHGEFITADGKSITRDLNGELIGETLTKIIPDALLEPEFRPTSYAEKFGEVYNPAEDPRLIQLLSNIRWASQQHRLAINSVHLYGSRADGTSNVESDYNLIVRVPTDYFEKAHEVFKDRDQAFGNIGYTAQLRIELVDGYSGSSVDGTNKDMKAITLWGHD
jgi:hypothetical protein